MAAEVWIRPWASVSGTRWTRWHAALELEMAERPLAGDAERDLAEAAQLGRLHVQGLELPAHLLGEPAVHLVEVAGEQRGLVASGPGPDLHDQRRVVRARPAVVEQVAERLALLPLPAPAGPRARPRRRSASRSRSRRRRAAPPRRSAGPAPGSGRRASRASPACPRSFARAVTRDGSAVTSGSSSEPLDLQESLIVGLELLEHRSRSVGGKRSIIRSVHERSDARRPDSSVRPIRQPARTDVNATRSTARRNATARRRTGSSASGPSSRSSMSRAKPCRSGPRPWPLPSWPCRRCPGTSC